MISFQAIFSMIVCVYCSHPLFTNCQFQVWKCPRNEFQCRFQHVSFLRITMNCHIQSCLRKRSNCKQSFYFLIKVGLINYLIWIDQLNGFFSFVSISAKIVAFIFPFSIEQLFGSTFCLWIDFSGEKAETLILIINFTTILSNTNLSSYRNLFGASLT